jgi:hypothetical protein
MMLETVVALLLGHVLGDFVLQTDEMVRNKRKLPMLAAHVAVVVAASWLALGFAPVPLALLLVAVSHFAIDWLKLNHGGSGFAAFILDQAAHLVMILLAATLAPDAYRSGLWGIGAVQAALPWLNALPAAMAAAAGLIATIWAGGYAVQALMSAIDMSGPPAPSLPKGGQLIGRLERLMILMLVMGDDIAAIGFLIAAKSVMRFNEIAREDDRRVSEYVIIGTLASFAWAIGTGFATRIALTALRGS